MNKSLARFFFFVHGCVNIGGCAGNSALRNSCLCTAVFPHCGCVGLGNYVYLASIYHSSF